MKRTLAKLERLTDNVSLFSANIAAMILLLLVVITCVDVIGRYFFTPPRPLVGSRHDHIVVDLIPHFKRGFLGWLVSILFLSITFYVSITLGNRVFDYAMRAFEDGDVTEYLNIPRYPVVGFITAIIFTAAAITLLKLIIVLSKPGHSVEDVVQQNLGSVTDNAKIENQDAA